MENYNAIKEIIIHLYTIPSITYAMNYGCCFTYEQFSGRRRIIFYNSNL